MKRIQTSMTANFSDVHGGLSGVSRRQDEIVALQKEIIDMLRKAKADKAKADQKLELLEMVRSCYLYAMSEDRCVEREDYGQEA